MNALHARTQEILADLIALPTVSAESNLAMIDYIRSLLDQVGIASVPVFNEERTKANLFASIGPKNVAGILLSGHSDVVPVEGQAWTSDPFRMAKHDGKLFGRGTADMKGFIACVLAKAETLARLKLTKPYQMVFSYDEEIGCVGVRRIIEQFPMLTASPELCIIGEPTMMQPVIAHKGKVAGRILCLGHACHSSDALNGLNAIHLASGMVEAIRSLQNEIINGSIRDDAFSVPVTTLHVGTIHGGTALNIVPAECRLEFEIRTLPSQEADLILEKLFDKAENIVSPFQKKFPESRITIDIVNRYPGLDTSIESPALHKVQRLSGSNRAGKIAFGTEGGLFDQLLGVPVIVCGPGDIAQAHKADEYIDESQLDRCLAFLDRLTDELIAS
jgi:acetylornithine deacetylase